MKTKVLHGLSNVLVFANVLIFGFLILVECFIFVLHQDEHSYDLKIETTNKAQNAEILHELEELRLEYLASSQAQRALQKALILYRLSIYPGDKLPLELQAFYASLKASK